MTATITREDLAALIEQGDVVVVETLGPLHYADAHLPGAINVPHTEVDALAASLLPDRGATIVTYCSNTACRNSGVAADRLTALGYADVRKYAEGKQDWLQAGLPVERGAPMTA